MAKTKKIGVKDLLDKTVKKVSKSSKAPLPRQGSSEYKKLVIIGKIKE
jgi:hypothetical protein